MPLSSGLSLPLATAFDPVFLLDDQGRILSCNALAEELVAASTADSLIGRPLIHVLCPVRTAELQDLLAAAQPRSTGELRLEDQRIVAIHAVLASEGTAVQVQDITARRRLQDRSHALLDLNAQLAGNHSTRQIVQAVLERGADVLQANGASAFLLSRDGQRLETVGTFGDAPEQTSISVHQASPLTNAVQSRQAVLLTVQDRHEHDPDSRRSSAPDDERLIALPLVFGSRVLGGLTFRLKGDLPFGEAEEAFLESLAQICSQAFERAQLFDAQQRERIDRQQSERVLLAERARLEAVLDQLPVAVWIAEVPSGRLIAGNRAIETVLRFPYVASENVEAYSVYEGVHPDGRPYLAEDWPLARTVLTGETVIGEEIELVRTDGSRGSVAVSSVLIQATEESPVFAVATGTDITRRRELETQIKSWNADLERQISDRTDQLRAANMELDAFSYSVSHDLRRPLRHIAGFTGLLKRSLDGRLNSRETLLLETVEKSTRAMDTMIDALLAFARMSNQELRLSDVTLNELIDEAREQLAPDLLGRQVEWMVAPLPNVRADRTLLLFALLNLLGNAVKYTGTRDLARIEVGCEMKAGQLAVWIRDNGVGFDPRYQERMFGVFQRLHSEAQFEGIGIGLANVQRIITRHGGQVWAEGAVDQGATFWFSLPVQL